MKSKYLATATAIIATFSIALVFGCSRKEMTIETGEGKVTFGKDGEGFKIKTDKGTVTMTGDTFDIKSKEGEAKVSFGQNKLPENVSKEIPIYSPSQVVMSQVLNDGKNVHLSLTTSDDSEKVKKFYEQRMSSGGWNIMNTMNMGPATVLSGSKGDNELNVTLNRNEDQTIISLAFQKE